MKTNLLKTLSVDEVYNLIKSRFTQGDSFEDKPVSHSLGRVLYEDIMSQEDIPGFDRTTVDGYAVSAKDTFGSTESVPAIIEVIGSVNMGERPGAQIGRLEALAIPTGGMLPKGADAAVMVEYTEDYGDNTIGVLRPVSPGENIILKGDDVKTGELILKKGTRLKSHDIGTLSALGISSVKLVATPVVGLISTGDELVSPNEAPGPGQVRDVNTPMLAALIKECGGEPKSYGIIRDDRETLEAIVKTAVDECDVVVISGGSSVGTKDVTCSIIQDLGELLLHGISMKPGKPTILGISNNKPILGLPGHPAAAYFVAHLFLRQLISIHLGCEDVKNITKAILTESVSSNHGRTQFTNVQLYQEDGIQKAVPVRSKSGLIKTLSVSDGYICIPQGKEGCPQGEEVSVFLF